MKLILGNSFSKIEGLTQAQFQAVRRLLSYNVNSGASYRPSNPYNRRYLIDKKGVFPSGLLYLVREWIQKVNKAADVFKVWREDDPRKRPAPLQETLTPLVGVTPYAEQVAAVEAAVKAERGVIQACTGFGKSVTIALLIRKLQLRTLVVTPNLELKRQLYSTLNQLVGDLVPFTVENIDSPKLKNLNNFDVLIIDESHHAGATTYRRLNSKAWKNIYWRFCFTATSFRADEEEQLLMEAITGPVIYSVPYHTAVAKGYIVPVECYAYTLPKQKITCDPKHWGSVYSELVVNNEYRNKLLLQLLASLSWSSTPVLCLVKEIKHGQFLSDLSAIPFANGEDGLARQHILEFCLGETPALIGTIGVLGEGVDTKPAEYVILGSTGKAKTQFMQAVGRAVRKHPGKESAKVILIKDPSHPWLVKHYNACVKYLREEYNCEPVRLEYPKDLLL